jgi:hypothetical protein
MRRALGVLLAALLAAVIASPAQARAARHCAYWLKPIGPANAAGVVPTIPVKIGCYGTFARAIEAGSGGTTLLPVSTTPGQLTDRMLQEATDPEATESVMIGTEWDGIGFVVGSNSYFRASTCSATVSWEVSYVGDDVNDQFSSGKGFGGCDANRKFAASNFGGASKLCTPNCTNYGPGVSNEVSSLRWEH